MYSLILTPAFLILSIFFTPHPEEVSLQAGIGYRQGRFNWNIGGVDHEPNILSELTWKDLQFLHFVVLGDWKAPLGAYIKGTINGSLLFQGRNRDSDYYKDDRQEEFSRSINRSDRGHVFDVSAGIGRHYRLRFFPLTLYPMIGYSYHEQKFYIHDGEKTVSDKVDDLPKAIPGLNSSYLAEWHGPWLGIDADLYLGSSLLIRAGAECHFSVYQGKGHWNLRGDLPDGFNHESYGRGNKYFVSLDYLFPSCLTVGLIGQYDKWHAGKGLDSGIAFIPLSEQIVKFFFEQPFNEANWESFSLSLTIGKIF